MKDRLKSVRVLYPYLRDGHGYPNGRVWSLWAACRMVFVEGWPYVGSGR